MNKFLFLLSFTLLFSCKSNKKDNEHQHKEGSLEAIAHMIYTDKTELFVEFKPLIVGINSNFATHFTLLGDNFKPLKEGSVTVSLIVDGKGIKQTANAPAVPGLYRLSLQPKVAGKGELIFDITTKDFTDRHIIKDVTVYPDEKTALSDHADAIGDGSEITYLKEQAWKVEFANVEVVKKSISNIIKTSGLILPAPGDEMIVTARAAGIVRFKGNQATLGSVVKAGIPLFTIVGGDISQDNLDISVQQAKSNYEKAKSDFDRSSELVKDKIISVKEFEQDKLVFENAKANYNMISKSYTGEGLNIITPMNGYIKNIFVTEGQFVAAGTPLATITKKGKLVLQANVSQKYFDMLPLISSANFKTVNSDELYSTEALEGKLISYGKSASNGSPFIPIAFEINNTSGIIPGSIAEVYLKFSELQNVLIVPVAALIEEQGSFFVYVQTGGESFQKREIKLGASDGLNVQVLSGIAEGERVVTKGAYQIKLSTASGTLPAHGHEH